MAVRQAVLRATGTLSERSGMTCVRLEALRVRGGTSDGSAAVLDITGF